MNEKEILLSHSLDAKNRCADNSMITHTNFVSVDERDILRMIEKEQRGVVKTFYYGGFEDAERTVAVFVPDFYGVENIEEYFAENSDENPIQIIRIEKDKFSSLSHRDYLGSLMGLGIKREVIGDIKVDDEGAYVFALKSISRYICENLQKAGRGSVKCTLMEISELPKAQEKTEICFSSVASLRLDNIVSAAFNLSRSLSSQMIQNGAVYVNSLQILKTDYNIKEKDKIVLRGKGKVVVEEIIGESKKGRIHINIKKYR